MIRFHQTRPAVGAVHRRERKVSGMLKPHYARELVANFTPAHFVHLITF